jgi:hypothetical protein
MFINVEHLLRELDDTDASNSIILEAYTIAIFPFIKTDDNNTTTGSSTDSQFIISKTGICL